MVHLLVKKYLALEQVVYWVVLTQLRVTSTHWLISTSAVTSLLVEVVLTRLLQTTIRQLHLMMVHVSFVVQVRFFSLLI